MVKAPVVLSCDMEKRSVLQTFFSMVPDLGEVRMVQWLLTDEACCG